MNFSCLVPALEGTRTPSSGQICQIRHDFMTVVILIVIVKDTPPGFSELHMKIKTVRCNNSAFFQGEWDKTIKLCTVHSPPEDPEAQVHHTGVTLLRESAVGKTQTTNEIALIALLCLLDSHVPLLEFLKRFEQF